MCHGYPFETPPPRSPGKLLGSARLGNFLTVCPTTLAAGDFGSSNDESLCSLWPVTTAAGDFGLSNFGSFLGSFIINLSCVSCRLKRYLKLLQFFVYRLFVY